MVAKPPKESSAKSRQFSDFSDNEGNPMYESTDYESDSE